MKHIHVADQHQHADHSLSHLSGPQKPKIAHISDAPPLSSPGSALVSTSKFSWRHLLPVRLAVQTAQKACIKTLARTTTGFIRMTLSNGTTHEFGDKNESTLTSHITVLDDAFWLRVALFAAMGFGEAYMHAQIQCDDLANLLIILTKNRDNYQEMNLLPAGLNAFLNSILHSRIPNTILNAVTNIQAHYDLGNEMFGCFLDPTMMYSCPIWATKNGRKKSPRQTMRGSDTQNGAVEQEEEQEEEEDTLERAQYRKIDAMLDLASIRASDKVLEIGTGWGALAIRAVQRFNCTVTTLTLSTEQKHLAEARIAAAGLSASITVKLLDYRNMDPRRDGIFDRIIAVEMLEAVGPEFLPVFFSKCNELLHPHRGILALQVITMPDARYESYLKKVDFINRYIFPGGHCPSVTALTDAAFAGSKGSLVLDDLANIGPHYAKALRLWRIAFSKNCQRVAKEHDLEDRYDAVFQRKWEFYFAYCEAGFATRTLGNVQVRFSRIANEDLLEGVPL
ncbi:hypothetical protein PhCBS80983_g03279 [Powellomyces hirtus]|uniref:Cyclopropane-fatty-acyl-phospholipid synthase n=1 Tax=Powellomyces hirtus TaxID=109895 RepID=A0A507E3D6_9FUNG|nr:hypothetical protein PhCBS80983_g03279 [Powellomyces hirtus]